MPQQGLFDTRSQEQILNDRWRERHAQQMQMVPQLSGPSPGEQTAGTLGGLLAGAIGKRFQPPTLTPEEQARTTAIQAAAERTKKWKLDHPNASVEDMGLETQRHIAEELIRAGDMQGIPIAQSVAEQSQARARATAELAKLQGETAADAAALRQMNWDFEKKQSTWERGGMQNVWLPGENWENGGRVALISNEGPLTATFDDPETGERHVETEFFSHPPQKGFRDASTLLEMSIGSAEANQNRQGHAAVLSAMRGANSLYENLKESVDDTGQINLLGRTGAGASWVSGVINDVKSAARLLGLENSVAGVAEGEDLSSSIDDAKDYVLRNGLVQKAVETGNFPELLGKTAEQQARWMALHTQLAYARGMAAEPGARQLSDNDFQVQMLSNGAMTTDPETFRRIMYQNIQSDINRFYDRWTTYSPKAQELMIHAPTARSRFDAERSKFEANFNLPYGTAGSPGPGLLRDNALINDLLNE